MKKPSKVLLLINPKARQGESACEKCEAEFTSRQIEFIRPEVTAAQFSECIKQYSGQIEAVVAAGGDGTVRMAAVGAIEAGLPLGVLPLGTANNFARITGGVAEAAEVIAQGHRGMVDVGLVNNIQFLNVVGIGLSTKVNQEVPRKWKRLWGKAAYVVKSLSEFTTCALLQTAFTDRRSRRSDGLKGDSQ